MKIWEMLAGKKGDENSDEKPGPIPRRNVQILSIKDEKGNIGINYDFGFDFVTENDKRRAVVWINEEKMTLDKGQSAVFILESGDIEPFRLKVTPDFQNEGCHTASCFDPRVKDSDI